ncbi:hypothetical protein [Streptomyces specialis]|uniref:hypothetical protein n=1 Tax=Streptomyces specialis TaxID=498367 RepID=UPI00073F668C|nr:hypothetical protein [Streptomyces specialis]
MNFTHVITDVRRRPNAYALRGYREFVAFVNGYNTATGGQLLDGFSARLAGRLGRGGNLHWAELIAKLATAPEEVRTMDDMSGPQEEQATKLLFEELLAFLAAPGPDV